MDMDKIILDGINSGASDIHFIPDGNKVSLYFRTGDTLDGYMDVDPNAYQILLQKTKAMAQMNISEKRLPQDGILRSSLGENIRVSTLRSLQGESMVLRLFKRDLIALEDLGFTEGTRCALLESVLSRSGIFLISGETGMGKSTTLYALMMKLRDRRMKVIAIEDPVERVIPGIVQTQISEASGYTYEKAIFAALRQDPDYICIGEIRSKETASALIRAALTGHKVLSTIHAHNFESAVRRLRDFGIGEGYISHALTTVMHQTLNRNSGRRRADGILEFSEDQRQV